MKILRLRLTNLNSLRGTWEIDFTQPPLANAGLFAITGPTGAGKSTLLDALTLALYGRAARYGNQSSPETVMSRHTGECAAEVEFSCAAGTFRSVWQLHRSRKKPNGDVQAPKRRVIELPSETILTEKIDQSQAKILELTGLDYDRFLRSVLLAQGEFAAFLKANARERTELLQQVTGTDIYQEISKAAYRQSEAARQARDQLTEKNQALPVLSEDERAAIETERAGLRERLAALRPESAALAQRLAAVERWQKAEQTAAQLATEQIHFAAEHAAAAPDLAQLTEHERAGELAPALAKVDVQRFEQLKDQARLKELQRQLPDLEERLATATNGQGAAQQLTATQEAHLAETRGLWDEVAALDEALAGARQGWEQWRQQRVQAETQVSQVDTEKKRIDAERSRIGRELEKVDQWLQTKVGDAAIAKALPELQGALIRWSTAGTQTQQAAQKLAETRQQAEALTEQAKLAGAELPVLEANRQQDDGVVEVARVTLLSAAQGRTLEELETQKAVLNERRQRWQEVRTLAALLRNLTTQVAGKRNESAALTAALAVAEQDCAARRERQESAARLVEATQNAHSLSERVQSLEEHRAALLDGEPCPLCGASEHPFAAPGGLAPDASKRARAAWQGATAELSKAQDDLLQSEKTRAGQLAAHARLVQELAQLETEWARQSAHWPQAVAAVSSTATHDDTASLENGAEAADREDEALSRQITAIKTAETALRTAQTTAQKSAGRLQQAQAESEKRRALAEQAAGGLPALTKAHAQAVADAQAQQAGFAGVIAPFLAPAPADSRSAAEAVLALNQRAELHANQAATQQKLQGELATQTARLEAVAQQLAAGQLAVQTVGSKETEAQAAHHQLVLKRTEKFGARVVADERRAAEQALARLRAAQEAARATAEQRRNEWTQVVQEKTTLEKELAARTTELQASQEALNQRAVAAGFADLVAVQRALLTIEVAQARGARRKALEERRVQLQSRTTLLASERAQIPPTAAEDAARLDELQATQSQLQEQTAELNQTLGARDESLKKDDALRHQQRGFAAEIEAAQREFQRWDRLRGLIGSADGSLFARFAQGLTLERLVVLANRHMAELNPRYRIERAKGATAEDLELEIIDGYQADVTRPMRSLSGGESFLVSLALALGLSELASGARAIESLFIDEGFGTLDAETLETAMAALENLQARGKTIGVISHVAAMQERIPQQIRIEKTAGGCSRIVIVDDAPTYALA